MSAVTLQNDITQALSRTSAVYIQKCPGRFDLTEVMQRSIKTPAVFVGVLANDSQNHHTTTNMACYVLTLPTRQDESNQQGIALVEQVQHILQKDFTTKTNAQNLYSGKFNNHNIGLWAITFEIKEALMPLDDAQFNQLDDFEHFNHTTNQLAGEFSLGE